MPPWQKGWRLGIEDVDNNPGAAGTPATLPFENRHSDSSVALWTGHRDSNSLKYYQNLRGAEGVLQQRDLFGAPEEPHPKRARVQEYSNAGDDGGVVPAPTRHAQSASLSHIGTVLGGEEVNLAVSYN